MFIKHGDSVKAGKYNRIYNIWRHMKRRCYAPEEKHYDIYGGKGITICDDWLKYENFREWSINNGYEESLSIDRIKNDKNYEPRNCRWVSQLVQQNNRTNNLYLEYKGKRMTVADLARETGRNRKTLQARYHRFNADPVKMLDYRPK